MSSHVLTKPDGTTKEISVTSSGDLNTSRTNVRLEQPPGMSQSFPVGRSDEVVGPIVLTVLIQAATEALARTANQELYDFARDATTLSRTGVSEATEAASFRALHGDGGSVLRVSPTPLHRGGTDWGTVLMLAPRDGRYEYTPDVRVTSDGTTRVTAAGITRVVVT